MAKLIFGNCILALLVLSILSSLTAASSRKTAVLEQKVIEISALRAKIIDKIDQGIEMRIFLQKRLNELRDEIKVEKQNLRTVLELMGMKPHLKIYVSITTLI